MKKYLLSIYLLLAAGGALMTSCSSKDADLSVAGEGKVMVKLNPSTSFAASTRAVNENTYKDARNYTVTIQDAKGEDHVYTYADLQTPITLPLGSSIIKAEYGTNAPASRTGFYVFGQSNFNVTPDGTAVTVNCEPQCGKVSAEFDPNMNTFYTEYHVVFSNTKAMKANGGSVAPWAKTDTDPYYLALDGDSEEVTYTILLTAKDEYTDDSNEGKVTGTLTLNRNKWYKFKIAPSFTEDTTGSLSITITIDESTNDRPINIEVPVEWTF